MTTKDTAAKRHKNRKRDIRRRFNTGRITADEKQRLVEASASRMAVERGLDPDEAWYMGKVRPCVVCGNHFETRASNHEICDLSGCATIRDRGRETTSRGGIG